MWFIWVWMGERAGRKENATSSDSHFASGAKSSDNYSAVRAPREKRAGGWTHHFPNVSPFQKDRTGKAAGKETRLKTKVGLNKIYIQYTKQTTRNEAATGWFTFNTVKKHLGGDRELLRSSAGSVAVPIARLACGRRQEGLSCRFKKGKKTKKTERYERYVFLR